MILTWPVVILLIFTAPFWTVIIYFLFLLIVIFIAALVEVLDFKNWKLR